MTDLDYTKNHPDHPAMRRHTDTLNRVSVQDLAEWCLRRDLAPADVHITGVTVVYYAPESDAQRATRERWEADNAARKDRWERDTYERLRAKFEGQVDD